MRWLTGWSGSAPGAGAQRAPSAVRPLAGTALWGGPNPLWAVGDWRPDEIRLVTLRPGAPAAVSTVPDPVADDTAQDTPATTRLAVLGRCGASDAELAAGLAAARGGAVRHLTSWPGSYTVVLRSGTRSTLLLTDLAGVLPVFHTPWTGGTAYATAALPLADLIGAPLDTGHLAARLACPESPEALGTGTPFVGVRRVPPGHVLAVRGGHPYVAPYEQGGAQGRRAEAPAVRELTRALLESVRCRVRTSAVAADRPGLGVDLSYGTASATVALLAAAVPISPPARAPGPDAPPAAERPRTGAVKGSWARPGHQRPVEPLAATRPPPPCGSSDTLTAVTVGEASGSALAVEVPRLRHIVLPPTLPYAELADALPELPPGPLTDEPGPVLVSTARIGTRFSAGGADHLTGYGARQVLDGHPARLADLIRDGRPRELLPPVVALAGADRAAGGSGLRTPVAVLRAANRLARARYAEALDDAAVKLTVRQAGTAKGAAAALAWCVPGPAARWLSDDALSAVALRLRLAARGPAPTEPPGARLAGLALHRRAAEYRTLVQATEQYGQRLHAPFLDNQVVRAAGLLPDEIRLQPGARHALLRAVLTGAGRSDLPADWGRGPRPDRATAARTGLRLAADGLAELFREPLLAEAGLIDLPAVRRALTRAADPAADLPPGTLAGLADLVSTELWLRRVRARRHGSCWTGLPLPERPALPLRGGSG
ncbi:lasso peptide isopeptide bond-forming cyclase [Kitasatospora kazusensis]|uniref:Lasso peptide isopeptide bond-forming cyclase n=1 Tax=Kitasatospora kazusensis TaxID=407974 RepID=A0ABN2Z9J1_9ACTN